MPFRGVSLSLDVVLHVFAWTLSFFLLSFLVLALTVPVKALFIFAANLVKGGVILLLVNLIMGYFGWRLGINPISAIIAGYLGVPGIGLLMALKYLLL